AIREFRSKPPGSIYIIPLKLSECELPNLEIDGTRRLRDLKWIDYFPSTKRTQAFKSLLESIHGIRERPTDSSSRKKSKASRVGKSPWVINGPEALNRLEML